MGWFFEFKSQCQCLYFVGLVLSLALPDITGVSAQGTVSSSYNYRQVFFPSREPQSEAEPNYSNQYTQAPQFNFPAATTPLNPGDYYDVPASAEGTGSLPDVQQMFRDMFDWRRDIGTDPRFQSCTLPDISQISESCPEKEFYYGMNPAHRMAVGMVKNICLDRSNLMESVCVAGAMRDMGGMNPNVWIRGVLAARMTREELFDLDMPPVVEVVPNIFINSDAMRRARRQSRLPPQSRRCAIIDGHVGQDNGVENLLWYWREDVMVNSFHMSWHLTYPFSGITVRPDRRGELFYFTHHSHLARYHAERLSNGLSRVEPLNIEYNGIVPEQYHPHLDDTNSGRSWTPRGLNSHFLDTSFINIPGVPQNISISLRAQDIQRVEEAIYNRAFVTPNGQPVRMDALQGVDLLGDVIEASVFSINPNLYGPFGFHNEGHALIGVIEDPRNRLRIPPGVMVEVATSMRDPVFYSYHTPIDDMFDNHKQTLAPYTPTGGEYPLIWSGVEVTHVHVVSDNSGDFNHLKTFFNEQQFDLSRGLDFNRSRVQGPIRACVTHLDHHEFQYQISVNRGIHSRSSKATVRIFLAPRFDEYGQRYTIAEQRRLFFMMDLFTTDLEIGQNVISRSSLDSTLTVFIPQSLREITIDKGMQRPYCGCGWPHHLLIPKGTETGMVFDLFVMLTNGDIDEVPPRRSQGGQGSCKPAPIYCGRLNDTYPDRRPMGYPFDRLPYSLELGEAWYPNTRQVKTLEEYTSYVPNMAAIQVKISHIGKQVSTNPELTSTGPLLADEPAEPTVFPQQSSRNVDFRDVVRLPTIREQHFRNIPATDNRNPALHNFGSLRTLRLGETGNFDYRWHRN